MKFLKLYQKALLAICDLGLSVNRTYARKCPKLLRILLLPIFIAFELMLQLLAIILSIPVAIAARIMGLITFKQMWQMWKEA